MPSRVELVREELDDAYRMIRDRVEGLSDEEFWWAPVEDAWTVRKTDRGTWAADYEYPDPEPAPITTIGWRVVHVAECKVMYHEYAFGEARLTWPDLDSPHTAADSIRALERGNDLVSGALRTFDDDALSPGEDELGRVVAGLADLLDDDPSRSLARWRDRRPTRSVPDLPHRQVGRSRTEVGRHPAQRRLGESDLTGSI